MEIIQADIIICKKCKQYNIRQFERLLYFKQKDAVQSKYFLSVLSLDVNYNLLAVWKRFCIVTRFP